MKHFVYTNLNIFLLAFMVLYLLNVKSFLLHTYNVKAKQKIAYFHHKAILSMIKTNGKSGGSGSKKNKNSLGKSQHKKILPPQPEFSRIVNVGQVPPNGRPVLCRIIAKEKERLGLSKRFDIDELTFFSANVTLTRRDSNSVHVTGNFEAQMKVAELVPAEVLMGEFDTLLLDNSGNGGSYGGDSYLDFSSNMDYDDEVGADGSIDIGEIASQYFSLEM